MSRRALALALLMLFGCEEPAANLERLESALVLSEDLLRVTVFDDLPAFTSVPLEVRGEAFVELEHRFDVIDDGARYALVDAPSALAPGEHTLTVSVLGDALGASVARLTLSSEGRTHEVTILAEVVEIPDCDDDNPCTEDRFDREILACTYTPLDDGASCDDDNACTENTRCEGAVCLGEPITCADGVGCTADTCDPASGCAFVGVDARCDDDAPCTDDVCTPTGCENPPKPLGSVCAFNGCESIGLCGIFGCEEHAVPDGAPCEDGDRCTTGDTCQAGECTSGTQASLGVEPLSLNLDHMPRTVHDIKAHSDGFEILWRTHPSDPCEINARFLDPPEEQEDRDGLEAPPRPVWQVCRSELYATRWREDGETTTTFVAWTAVTADARFDDVGRVLVSDLDDDGNGTFYWVEQANNSLVAPIDPALQFDINRALVIAPGPDTEFAFAQELGHEVRFGTPLDERTVSLDCEIDRPQLDWVDGAPRAVVRERCAPRRAFEIRFADAPVELTQEATRVALNDGEIAITVADVLCDALVCDERVVVARDDTLLDYGHATTGALLSPMNIGGATLMGVIDHAQRVELHLDDQLERGRDTTIFFDTRDGARNGSLLVTAGLDGNIDFDCPDVEGILCLPPNGQSASVARFGCVPPALCMVDDDCEGAETCDHTTCHAPPECATGACEPVCYGACTL